MAANKYFPIFVDVLLPIYCHICILSNQTLAIMTTVLLQNNNNNIRLSSQLHICKNESTFRLNSSPNELNDAL